MSRKGFANIVLVIIAIVVLAGAGAGYLAVKKQKAAAPQPQTASAPTSTVANETAGWKICRNEQYGYEVRHPADWGVWKIGPPEIVRKTGCEEGLAILQFSQDPYTKPLYIGIDVSDAARLKGTIYEGVKSLDEYFSRSPAILQARPIVRESTLGGERLVWHSDGSLTVFHNNSVFDFRRSVDDTMMEKFLATFKFTK